MTAITAPAHKAAANSNTCPKCCKPDAEFGPNKARKNGRQVYCRKCMRDLRTEKQYDKRRWVEFRDVESARNKEYRIRNADRLKPIDCERSSARRLANPGVIRAHNIARKHGEKKATPLWADKSALNAVYHKAREMQEADGIVRHVDHQIPLKHPLVCGLHVPRNLCVLTATANMSKHNSFSVDMDWS